MSTYTVDEALNVLASLHDRTTWRIVTRLAADNPDAFMAALAAIRRADAQARRNHPSASPTAQMVNAQEYDA